MSARQPGQQIDVLPLLLSIEEQANENAQRVDNVMRNLVELARAVRSLVQRVEQHQARLDERVGEGHELYELTPPVFAEDLPSSQFAILQAADSQLGMRLAQLEEQLHNLGPATSGPPADLRPFEERISKLETVVAQTVVARDKPGVRSEARPADLTPILRQLDALQAAVDSSTNELESRVSAVEGTVHTLSENPASPDPGYAVLAERLAQTERSLADLDRPAAPDPAVASLAERLAQTERALADLETPLFPDPAIATLADRLDQAERAIAELSTPASPDLGISTLVDRLAQAETAIAELEKPPLPDPAVATLADRLAKAENALATLGESADAPEQLQIALAELDTRLADIQQGQSQQAGVRQEELEERLAALAHTFETSLQQQIEQLHAQVSSSVAGVSSEEFASFTTKIEDRLRGLETTLELSEKSRSNALEKERLRFEEQISAVESRLDASIAAHFEKAGGDRGAIERLHTSVDHMNSELMQFKAQVPTFAEQKQLSKLMEHLSDLQTRAAKQADQLQGFEQVLQRGSQEQQLQLQNQLDMQERQRVLIEQLAGDLASVREQIGTQQALLEQHKSNLSRLTEMAEKAASAHELRRRASDEQIRDSTMQPLIESALHIERGEYAEAVRCLEAAHQLSDNPKLEQALQLARQMLEQQTSPEVSSESNS